MISAVPQALIPWLDPNTLLGGVFGPVALLVVCAIVFAETGLLVGFLLPGDTLLFFTGVLAVGGKFGIDIWWVCLAISLAAFLGGEVGYLIGHKLGPRVFERKESGLFSVRNVERTNAFFERFGALAVIMARFVPIVRTFAPIAAGVGHMNYKKYSLYNAVGALIWGSGITLLGFGLGQIEPVREFTEKYLDVVLICVVVLTIIPTVFHYLRERSKARKDTEAAIEEEIEITGAAERLTLEPEVFGGDVDTRPKP
ncbi:VTT domain-containing protein [Herbiconiux sp. CPCC 203407]|uniref:VTT domain-containing protein n=1 Tax=Herbiconiux oxytropis TaxID=2970915 RepID=A0AA42BTV4_9MICO|nr:VTT domain-containing protein [Herbiconiux oxytropis]MCS5721329.1 VTT domain-containing protein [Herbiconiux oxytropis]MCS5726232.1 VTT domain-containing protein [Herbiconiux oxytropis]